MQHTVILLKIKNISINYRHLLPDLVPWLNLIGSNYPSLEQISMVPKIFEPLKFYCISHPDLAKYGRVALFIMLPHHVIVVGHYISCLVSVLCPSLLYAVRFLQFL